MYTVQLICHIYTYTIIILIIHENKLYNIPKEILKIRLGYTYLVAGINMRPFDNKKTKQK